MRLDRNVGSAKTGKYAVVNMRKVDEFTRNDTNRVSALHVALRTLTDAGVIDYGEPNTKDEFFVVYLKDRFAQSALMSYALAATVRDPEYAKDVQELADRAGLDSPWCKFPD